MEQQPSARRATGLRAALKPIVTQALTPRAVGLALVLAVLLALLTPSNDFALLNTYFAGNHFPMAPFIVLLFLAFPVNLVLRYTRLARPFTKGELVTIWCMLIASSGIPSSGLLRLLIPVPAGAHYYAETHPDWKTLVIPHIPDWLLVSDRDAVQWYFESKPETEPIPWHGWLKPTIAWGTFVIFFYWTTMCLTAILRRQWVERERFPFPLVNFPVELAAVGAEKPAAWDILKRGGFWGTVLIVVFLRILDGYHIHNPSVPRPPFLVNASQYFTERPWRYMGGLYLRTYPMVIGLSYLTRTEMCFSFWFWYLFLKVQQMYRGYLGLPPGLSTLGAGPAYQHYQQFGVHLAFFLWIIWVSRGYLRQVLAKARGANGIDDAQEAMRYKVAVWGAIVGYFLCSAWLVAAGVSVHWALWAIAGNFIMCTVLSWLVTNAGYVMVQSVWLPIDSVVGFFGSNVLSARDRAVWPIVDRIFISDPREILMPTLLNGLRAADVGLSRRQILRAMMLTVAIVAVIGTIMGIRMGYIWAALTCPNQWAYTHSAQRPYLWTETIAKSPITWTWENNWNAIYNTLVGFSATLLMFFIRTRWLAFGLHPAGWAVAKSWSGRMFWFSYFLGWAIKTILLRIGGYKMMQRAKPVFLGLVVGDAIAALIWIIVGWILQDPDHPYFVMPH